MATQEETFSPTESQYQLLSEHEESLLADKNFKRKSKDLNTHRKEFNSLLWEAQLGKFIREHKDIDYDSHAEREEGPDFKIEHKMSQSTIWVEAVVPTEGDLNISSATVIAAWVNKEGILSRYTSSIKEKSKKICAYITAENVQPEDICIIAISSISLGDPLDCFDTLAGNGVTQNIPYAFQAVYGKHQEYAIFEGKEKGEKKFKGTRDMLHSKIPKPSKKTL